MALEPSSNLPDLFLSWCIALNVALLSMFTTGHQQFTLLHVTLPFALPMHSSSHGPEGACLQSATHQKLSKALVLQVLCQSTTCCTIPAVGRFAAGMLLVDTQMKTLRRPAALSDFLHCQDGHLGDIVDALRSDWLLKVGLRSGLHLGLEAPVMTPNGVVFLSSLFFLSWDFI